MSNKLGLCLLAACLVFTDIPAQATGVARATLADRDGQHDFDFNLGTWHSHLRRLKSPLAGSSEWIDFDGKVAVRKVWDGKAQLEEIELDGPNGHWQGATLFLYNPGAHQWSQNYVNSSDGSLRVPMIGEFKYGRVELFDQETWHGRSILVRATWSEIKPDSHRYEEAFSDDGGKTWETNIVGTLTRTQA